MRSHILQFGSNFSPLLTIYCISILIVIYGILKIIHITYILQGALNISLRHPRVYFETYTGRKCEMTCITIRIRVDLLCILRHSLATNARSQLIQYSSNNAVVSSNSDFVHLQKPDTCADTPAGHKVSCDWMQHVCMLWQCTRTSSFIGCKYH